MNCRAVPFIVLGACASLLAAEEGRLLAGRDVPVPRLAQYTAPRYPPVAYSLHVQGDVVLEVAVDAEGRPGEIRFWTSIPLLDDAAVKAVKEWRYEPTLVDRTAQAVVVWEPVPFRIGDADMAQGYSEIALRRAWPSVARISAMARLQQMLPRKRELVAKTLRTLVTDKDALVAKTAASALAALRADTR